MLYIYPHLYIYIYIYTLDHKHGSVQDNTITNRYHRPPRDTTGRRHETRQGITRHERTYTQTHTYTHTLGPAACLRRRCALEPACNLGPATQ